MFWNLSDPFVGVNDKGMRIANNPRNQNIKSALPRSVFNKYLEVHSLARVLRERRTLPDTEAVSITADIADALQISHDAGVIHRDIKSGNVMVTDSGQVKILDFGLAKLLDEQEAATSGIHQTELTEVGVPYGTATYAAPEQARGDKVDARADIFSTGVLLYEMLTG
ncbi:MAG: serine/threonine-protein kinase, partial [Pyrinomonadaceae bacterium]